MEAARIAGIKRLFYASSACIYPEYKQLEVTVEGGGLKEADAWPAQPQARSGAACAGAGAGAGAGCRGGSRFADMTPSAAVSVPEHSPKCLRACCLDSAALAVTPVPLQPSVRLALSLLATHLVPAARLVAFPQDAYGLEKLASEELCMHYDKDFGISCRIARFHNIYGEWVGEWAGRSPSPACLPAYLPT
jgi:hypothetical protein